MTEYEQRAVELLSEKHIGRMLLFRPSDELFTGLVNAGAICESLTVDDANRIAVGQDMLDGEYICMLIGNLPDISSNPVELLTCLQQHLNFDGAIVAVSEKYSAEEITEMIKQAKFRDVCFCKDAKSLVYRVQKMMSKTIMLQQHFTAEIRHALLYLLRRVETGIDTEKNIQAIWALCEKEKITADFLLPFIENTMIKPKKVLTLLAGNTGE